MDKEIEEKAYNSKKHTFFWHLLTLKNIQDRVLEKNRSELRKMDIENIVDLCLRIGIRHENLPGIFHGSYPIKKHEEKLRDLFDPPHKEREDLQRKLRDITVLVNTLTSPVGITLKEDQTIRARWAELQEDQSFLQQALARPGEYCNPLSALYNYFPSSNPSIYFP